jgi:ABC-type polysaccharide/polyol phosphate transport system ATPase subunit
MMVRLCFAVATSVHREILLMDEWLAGGDAGFLMKVHQRMEDFLSDTSILVLASHSMERCENGATGQSSWTTGGSLPPAKWTKSPPSTRAGEG